MAVPVVVGLVVLVIVVGAVLSIENRQPAAASLPGGASTPGDTSQPLVTQSIPYPNVPRVSPQEARDRLERGQAILVDVRSKASYDKAHAEGAVSIPEEEIGARLGQLPRDKGWILY